eukprot:2649124-Rhodomonas_salina.1
MPPYQSSQYLLYYRGRRYASAYRIPGYNLNRMNSLIIPSPQPVGAGPEATQLWPDSLSALAHPCQCHAGGPGAEAEMLLHPCHGHSAGPTRRLRLSQPDSELSRSLTVPVTDRLGVRCRSHGVRLRVRRASKSAELTASASARAAAGS